MTVVVITLVVVVYLCWFVLEIGFAVVLATVFFAEPVDAAGLRAICLKEGG